MTAHRASIDDSHIDRSSWAVHLNVTVAQAVSVWIAVGRARIELRGIESSDQIVGSMACTTGRITDARIIVGTLPGEGI